MTHSNHKGLILAAGRGSRMNSLTENKPKCFVKLAGRRLFDWQLQSLRSGGIHDISVVTGFHGEKFKSNDYNTIENRDWNNSNMVVSLLRASAFIDRPTIVSYSDIVYHPAIVQDLQSKDHDITLVYDKSWLKLWDQRFSDPLQDAESFEINKKGQIIEIGKKVQALTDIQGQYIGLFKLTKNGIDLVYKTVEKYYKRKNTLDMTALFQLMIKENIKIFGMPIDAHWCEIDSPSDLELAEKLYQSGQLKIY